MTSLSFTKAAINEKCRFNATFCRPSSSQGGGWVASSSDGYAIIQVQTNKDGNEITVVRYINRMGLDGLNGRILPGLPICRERNSKEVYFKTSSTTTVGTRRKAPFAFKFRTVEEAEEFEMWWLFKNGSIDAWKEQDAKKKASGRGDIIPLQETTNASTPVRQKRKACDTNDSNELLTLLSKRLKMDDSDGIRCDGGVNVKDDAENIPALCAVVDDCGGGCQRGNSNSCSVRAFKTTGLDMPTENRIDSRMIIIVEGHSIEDSTNLGGDKSIKSNNNNTDISHSDSDSDSDSDSHSDSDSDSDNVDVIVDEEDASFSQNWMTAFAPYD